MSLKLNMGSSYSKTDLDKYPKYYYLWKYEITKNFYLGETDPKRDWEYWSDKLLIGYINWKFKNNIDKDLKSMIDELYIKNNFNQDSDTELKWKNAFSVAKQDWLLESFILKTI